VSPPPFPTFGLGSALLLLAGLIVTYLAVGLATDVRRRRRERAAERIRRDLATVLFRPGDGAAAAAERLVRGSRSGLLDLIQRLAADLDGDADRRLRQLVGTAGLSRRIRRRIRSRSWRSRAQGAALASLLPAGDPARLTLLGDPHPLVRARAVEAMEAHDIGRGAQRVTAMLEDPSPAVRMSARNALLRGGAPVASALRAHLEAAEGIGAVFALEVAAALPDVTLIPVIERHARSKDPDRRARAARALRPWAERTSVLVTLLDDDDPEVRAAAAQAMGDGGVARFAADIGRLLRDRTWTVRRSAAHALAALGPAGVMTLRVHVEDEDPYARDLARQTLAMLEAREVGSWFGSALAGVTVGA
jgi:hypothetical protein